MERSSSSVPLEASICPEGRFEVHIQPPSHVQFLLGYVYIPARVIDIHLTAPNITRSFEADLVEMVFYLPVIIRRADALKPLMSTSRSLQIGPKSLPDPMCQGCGSCSLHIPSKEIAATMRCFAASHVVLFSSS